MLLNFDVLPILLHEQVSYLNYCISGICKFYPEMQYQVLLVAGNTRFSSIGSGIWILLAGSLCQTVAISLPKNTMQFTFDVSLYIYFDDQHFIPASKSGYSINITYWTRSSVN